MIRITGLYVYPIKSCRGTPVPSAEVTPRGLRDDRLLMLVDEGGRFLTQREQPRMALIAPALTADGLEVNAPGMAPLRLCPGDAGERALVGIWRDRCPAVDQGDEAAAWFGAFLGAPVRLVRIADGFRRTVDPAFARRPDDETGFADGFPFLLISEASLEDLNGRLATPLPMNRFRPNIVVAGCAPFAEDGWSDIVVNGVPFGVVKPCARCAITTTDQETGRVGAEPLRTLATYRQGIAPRPGTFFGQNLVSGATGVVRVGDAVTITTACA